MVLDKWAKISPHKEFYKEIAKAYANKESFVYAFIPYDHHFDHIHDD